MWVYTGFGAYFSTIVRQKPIGSTVQCAFSPFGRIVFAGLVHIPRKTNRSARE
jgi:hypothetical protein